MKLYYNMLRSSLVLGLGGLFLLPSILQADPPAGDPIGRKPGGGIQLDIGRFTPYARGLKIDIGPKQPNGERSVDVQVRRNGYIPVDVDVNVNPELRGPVYAERYGDSGPYTNGPDDDLLGTPGEPNELGAPSEPDLLGTPDENGPELGSPDDGPLFDAPPRPDEESNPGPIQLEEAPEPGAEPQTSTNTPDSRIALRANRPSGIVQASGEEPAAKPFLGVSVQPIGQGLASQFRDVIPPGAGLELTQVGKESPAEQAGLARHDILIAINGKPVGSLEELVDLVHTFQPDEEVTVTILRASRVGDVTVRLGVRGGQAGPTQKPTPITPPRELNLNEAPTEPAPRELSATPKPQVAPNRQTSEFYSPRGSSSNSSTELGNPSESIELPSP